MLSPGPGSPSSGILASEPGERQVKCLPATP